MNQHLSEVWRCIGRAESSLTSLEKASSPDQVREDWEDYLGHFGRGFGKLTTCAFRHAKTKGWANRLKNESTKNDPGLFYLREARNVSEHGLVPASKPVKPHADFGGFIGVEGPTNLVITASSNRGQPIRSVSGRVIDGKFGGHSSEKPDFITEVPGGLMLRPAKNEENGKIADVPLTLAEEKLQYGCPLSIVKVSLAFLKSKTEELEKLLSES